VSFVVNLMSLYQETDSVEPKPRDGFRHGKLAPHRVFRVFIDETGTTTTMTRLRECHVKGERLLDMDSMSRPMR
jgi:hypothetical protein